VVPELEVVILTTGEVFWGGKGILSFTFPKLTSVVSEICLSFGEIVENEKTRVIGYRCPFPWGVLDAPPIESGE
jgi:hypothetical protein